DFFDTALALDLLPATYVVLVRGHAFNARIRTERLAARERLVDVTDHPDVNDLMLASDAAVLDYSSLRFDYVLTGNPMVFLVPDLAEYDAARGGLIPYGPTAPGPHVSTTREVVGRLADLSALTAEYADARARFRADYVGLLQLRRQEDHRLVDQCVVEAQRGVVEHRAVRRQDQVVDVGVAGHVDDVRAALVPAAGPRVERVSPHQERVARPDLARG